MKAHYNFSLAIGFAFDSAKLFKQLGKPCKRKTHRESRWDPTTGKKLPDAEIVDHEAGFEAKIGGKTYRMSSEPDPEETQKLAGHIARLAGCSASWSAIFHGLESMVVFEVKKRRQGKSIIPSWRSDVYNLNIGAPIPLDAAIAEAESLKRVKAALEKLGLKCGQPKILITYRVGS